MYTRSFSDQLGLSLRSRRVFVRSVSSTLIFLFLITPVTQAFGQEVEEIVQQTDISSEKIVSKLDKNLWKITPLQSVEEEKDEGGGYQELSAGDDGFYQDENTDAVVRGTFSDHDANGAFRYNYALQLPPGRNDFTPALFLTYNNQDNSNISQIGYGWSLSIPYIKRDNREGVGVHRLYATSTFYSSIDGELVSIGGSDYIPKVDDGSYRKYELNSNVWRVTEKDGTVYTFGSTTASRQNDSATTSNIFKWMVDKVQETNDNSITFTYYKNQGEIYPDVISYGGSSTTTDPFAVHFSLANRTDEIAHNESGFIATTSYRIAQIHTEVDGQTKMTYTLASTTGDNFYRSLLASVTQTGQDGKSKTTNFSYTDSTNQYAPTASTGVFWAGGLENPSKGVRHVDVNGDGVIDWLKSFHQSGQTPINLQYVGTSTGHEFHSSSTIPIPDSATGYFDVAGYSGNRSDMGARFGDFNGDFKQDLIWNHDYDWAKLYLASSTATTSILWVDENPTAWESAPNIWGNEYNVGMQYVDFTGDGIDDRLAAFVLGSGGGTRYMATNPNTGSEFIANIATIPEEVNFTVNGDDRGVRLGDFNGDGLLDLVQSMWDYSTPINVAVYLNNGYNGWNKVNWSVPEKFVDRDPSPDEIFDVRVYDINSDGFDDIVHIANNNERDFYLGNGHGWIRDPETWSPNNVHFDHTGNNDVLVNDFDGDGMLDLLHGDTLFLYAGQIPDQLSMIVEPEGATTTVEYKASGEYLEEDGSRSNPIPFTINTVSKITRSAEHSDVVETNFKYQGGYSYYQSALDRDFGGFATTTQSRSDGSYTKTYYHQGNGSNTSIGENNDHISKAGKPYLIEEYDTNDNLFQKTINAWERFDRGGGASFVKLATTTTLTYDGDGDHKDTATVYTYNDATGNVEQMIEYGEVNASSDGTFSDTGSDKRTTDYTYTSGVLLNGFLTSETIKNNAGTKVAESKHYYDNQNYGAVTLGNRTKTEQWIEGSNYVDTEWAYNSFGLVTTETDPRNHVTSFGYDALNLYPASTTNALGHVTLAEYDYSSGKVATTTDPNGRVSVQTYDGLDRSLALWQPDIDSPSTLVQKTAFVYNDTPGSVSIQQTNYLNSATSSDHYTYLDGFGRKLQERSEGESQYAVVDYAYDERGLLRQQSLPYFSNGSSRTTATTSSALFTTFTYDPLNRPLTIANTVGTTTYAYDQWEEVITDANGNSRDLQKDAYGRLVQVDEHNDGATYTTNYEYSAIDNLTKITDALGNVRNFSYDGLGRRLTAEDLHDTGDGTFGVWSFAYDATSNVASSTDPNGNEVVYAYDDINRVLTENETSLGGTEITYGYDTCTEGIGRLCAATTTDSVTNYAYNALGLIDTESKTFDSTIYTTSFEYDRQGNNTFLTYPDNAIAKFVYNAAGFLESIQKKEDGEGSYSDVVTDIDYGPHGKAVYKEYANNTASTYTYDPEELYRLSNIYTGDLGGMGGSLEDLTIETPIEVLQEAEVAQVEEVQLIEVEEQEEEQIVAEEAVIEETEESTDITATSTESQQIVEEEQATSTEEILEIVEEEQATSTPEQIEDEVNETATTTVETATTTDAVKLPEVSLATDGLVKNINDARIWRKHHQERVEYLQKTRGVTNKTRIQAQYAQEKFEQYLLLKGYVEEKDGELKQPSFLLNTLWNGLKKLMSYMMPEKALAYLFGSEDFESCSSLPCSLDNNLAWGSVTPSLDNTGKVAGDDSLKEVVAGEGAGGIETVDYDASEIWIQFKLWIPDPMTWGGSGYAGILMLEDSSNAGTIWISLEDWGNPRLTVNGDVLSYTDTGINLVEGAVNTIEMRVKIGSSNGDIDLWVNNTNEGSPSYNGSGTLNTGTDNIDDIIVGLTYAPESGVSTTYFDDIIISDSFIGGGVVPPGPIQDIFYSYDAVGNITQLHDISDTNAAGTSTFAYDDLYRLTGATTTDSTSNFTRAFSYSAIGNILTKSDVGSYSYDETNYANPHAATSINGETLTYDNNGNLIGTPTTDYTYDYRNRLTQTIISTSTPPSHIYTDATTWQDWSWGSTRNYNDTSPVYEGSKSLEIAYTQAWGGLYLHDDTGIDSTLFDTLNVAVNGGNDGHQTLDVVLYEPDGTLIGVVYLDSYLADILPNTWYDISIPLADFSIGTSTIGGFSMESAASTTINLDYIRLKSSTGSTTTYLYDHENKRVAKESATTNHYPNQFYEVIEGTPTKHIFMGDELVATIEGTGTSSALYLAHLDHLGGTNVMTDSTGDINQLLSYYPFGATRQSEQASSFSETNKFTGHELDEETNLYYMQARYQEPQWGRFVGQDPASRDIGDQTFKNKYQRTLQQHLANPQALNSYSYAFNNPLSLVDNTGELPVLAAPLVIYAPHIMAGLSALTSSAFLSSMLSEDLATLADSNAGAGSKALVLLGIGPIGKGGVAARRVFNAQMRSTNVVGSSIDFSNYSRYGNQMNDIASELGAANVRATGHAIERIAERQSLGITTEKVINAYRSGDRYFDTKNNNFSYYKDGVRVGVDDVGTIRTVVKQNSNPAESKRFRRANGTNND